MSKTPRITTISFDGDATLWEFEKVMRHSLAIALDALRRRLPGRASCELTVDKMIEIRDTVAAELRGQTVSLEEIRLQAFKRTVESVGDADDSLAEDLNALYLKHRLEEIELYPDVIPILGALRSHFSLGLLSNGNSYLDRCGLTGYFSFVVLSQDVGVEKPDPAIFSAACKQARCGPTQLMHVGDSLQTDVAGAKAAGAVSVWLNRHGARNTSGVQPDHEIRSLTELVSIAERNARASDSSFQRTPGAGTSEAGC
jgi:putative hydrolase of the HAD superfamily